MAEGLDVLGTALVCTASEALAAAVVQAGFRVTRAAGAGEALPRVRHDNWDLVVLDGGTDAETLAYLHGLPGARRRSMFVAKVDALHATGDRFQAWSESVDLVVHPDDLDNLGLLLEEWMHDKSAFYRRFRDIQREAGGRLGAHA